MKTINIQTEISLDWMVIQDNIAAYQKIVKTNGEITEQSEGLAFVKDLENSTDGDLEIPFLMINDYKHFITMYPIEAKQFLLENVLYYRENINTFCKLELKNPFTMAKENKLNETLLIAISYGNYTVYDLNQKMLPKAIYYDYMSGVNNQNYDLEKFLEVLTAREDIVPAPNKNKIEIVQIPYYNAEEGKTKQIEFVWVPNEQDMEVVADYIWKSGSKNKAFKEIFGIESNYEY